MEAFLESLQADGTVCARFIGRVAGVEVDTDRAATVARLLPYHRAAVEEMGFRWENCWRAEQVHGAEIAVVSAADGAGTTVPAVDGLLTSQPGLVLGIYVADCGAIYLHDTRTGAIGLLHSGKKGTELGILPRALERMKAEFGTDASDVQVALAPCIRPPAYEVDFAAQIQQQALDAGVKAENYCDSGICTSSDLEKFYSYRLEQGNTGRMLALLGRVCDET